MDSPVTDELATIGVTMKITAAMNLIHMKRGSAWNRTLEVAGWLDAPRLDMDRPAAAGGEGVGGSCDSNTPCHSGVHGAGSPLRPPSAESSRLLLRSASRMRSASNSSSSPYGVDGRIATAPSSGHDAPSVRRVSIAECTATTWALFTLSGDSGAASRDHRGGAGPSSIDLRTGPTGE